MNCINIAGRLGRDAEHKTTTNGKKISTFSIATDRAVKKADGTWDNSAVWHNVVAFDLSEYVSDNLKKGAYIEVTGEQINEVYEKDGKKINTSKVQASKVKVAMKAEGAGSGSSRNNGSDNKVQDAKYTVVDDNDDLPF